MKHELTLGLKVGAVVMAPRRAKMENGFVVGWTDYAEAVITRVGVYSYKCAPKPCYDVRFKDGRTSGWFAENLKPVIKRGDYGKGKEDGCT